MNGFPLRREEFGVLDEKAWRALHEQHILR
jgi:hypothetical protein